MESYFEGQQMQQVGIIDLGSNTARMVVMQYQPHHSFKLIDEVKENVRLAHAIGDDNLLQADPIERAVETLQMFTELARALNLDAILAVTTSAVRDAANQTAFLAQMKERTGLRLRVLSGEEEAYYGYLGVVNSLDVQDGFIFDIGGGSVELSLVRGRGLAERTSLPLGTVRLTERLITSDPPSKSEIKALEQYIDAQLDSVPWFTSVGSLSLVGVGGTVRTLAKIDQAAQKYPIDRFHGYTLPAERVKEIAGRLSKLNRAERESVSGLSSDRADIIVAGAILIRKLLERTNAKALLVSGQGLRDGLFYEQFLVGAKPPLISNVRTFAIENLARNYHYNMVHADKVRQLSLELFDQLHPLHGYGAWERELLAAGAVLHDIGVAVNYYDHHKHSLYLLMNSALGGYTHRELALIALLTRNHRKGSINTAGLQGLLESGDTDRIARLSALLRMAEYLERSKSQVVQGVTCQIEKERVVVKVQAVGNATVEVWDANRRTNLFRKAYGLDVLIEV